VNQALTIAVTEESAATVWTLAPVTPPLAAWRHFPIQEGSEVTVEGALTQIWNHMVGTGWASSLAPAVLSWMYDFPAWYPDQSTWRAQLNDVLCPSVWVPYFVQGNSGFGDGDPPAAQPLPPR
jgi:hypothetical protein